MACRASCAAARRSGCRVRKRLAQRKCPLGKFVKGQKLRGAFRCGPRTLAARGEKKLCPCCAANTSRRAGNSAGLRRFTSRLSVSALRAARPEWDARRSDRRRCEKVDTCQRKTSRERISRSPPDGERHRAKGELTDIHTCRGAAPLDATTRPRGNSKKSNPRCAESGLYRCSVHQSAQCEARPARRSCPW